MKKVKTLISKVALFGFIFLGGDLKAALAAEKNLESHEHGVGIINLVVDSGEVGIELEVPAEDIVGFESKPVSKNQKQLLKDGVLKLKSGEEIFIFQKQAGCNLENAEIVSSLLDGHAGVQERDNHGEEGKHSHGHSKKYQKHGDEHEGKNKHKHEHSKKVENHEDAEHSEFVANYHFDCKDTSELKSVSVEFFRLFPSTQKLRVQFVGPNGQGSTTLTPTARNIILK